MGQLFYLTYDDLRWMVSVFRNHATSRAALMFTGGPAHGETIGGFEGKPHPASLAPDEYRALLKDNGFKVVSHVVEDPDCGHHSIWLAKGAGR